MCMPGEELLSDDEHARKEVKRLHDPKHFYIFKMDIKSSSKFLGFITMVCLLKFNIIEKIPFSVYLEIPCITFEMEKSFIANLWIQRPVVGLECIHWAWSAATAR